MPFVHVLAATLAIWTSFIIKFAMDRFSPIDCGQRKTWPRAVAIHSPMHLGLFILERFCTSVVTRLSKFGGGVLQMIDKSLAPSREKCKVPWNGRCVKVNTSTLTRRFLSWSFTLTPKLPALHQWSIIRDIWTRCLCWQSYEAYRISISPIFYLKATISLNFLRGAKRLINLLLNGTIASPLFESMEMPCSPNGCLAAQYQRSCFDHWMLWCCRIATSVFTKTTSPQLSRSIDRIFPYLIWTRLGSDSLSGYLIDERRTRVDLPKPKSLVNENPECRPFASA